MDMEDLPPTSEWRNETVCMVADVDKGFSVSDGLAAPLPVGQPIPIENDIFVGHVLLRIRNCKSDNPEQCKAYFDGKKRVTQSVLQGKFKRADIAMDQLMIGDEYEAPFKSLPPSWLLKPVLAFFRAIVPGIAMDLTSQKPSVFTNLVGGAQTMRADKDGQQPDICTLELEESMSMVLSKEKYQTVSKRRKYMSNPKHSAKYTFDPNIVYTFNSYDDIMDYGGCKMKMGMLGSSSMVDALSGQPAALGFRLKDSKEWLCRMKIYHTDLIKHHQEAAA